MERIWLAHYPAGVPADIDTSDCASLVQLFEDSCRRWPDRVAFRSLGVAMTYGELDRLARDVACGLQSQGLAKGDRIALMLPNILQYPVFLFGALRAGAVVVNCNPLYTPRELHHQLSDSGATWLVVVENVAHTAMQTLSDRERGDTAVKHVVITSIGELLGWLRGRAIDFVLRHVKHQVPDYDAPAAAMPSLAIPHTRRLSELLESGREHTFVAPAIAPGDLALLQYTGGTTGRAKGAMLTHGNVTANVLQAQAWIAPVMGDTIEDPGVEGSRVESSRIQSSRIQSSRIESPKSIERIVTALPLYHIFALTANCLVFIRLGAENLLIPNARDVSATIKAIRHYRLTALTGVNTLFNAWLDHPDFATVDFSALRFALGGGMAVHPKVAERWRAVTGRPLTQAYGLTEASPGVCMNPVDKDADDGSIGLPMPSTELSIRDDAHRAVALGEIGEICVRGPQVTQGYWHDETGNAGLFDPDGYLLTGDMGYMDERGFVFLVERKKDMILVSGFNVYPSEVEAVAASHPGVAEAAAIGVHDEKTGEAVKLFVVRRDPSLTAEALIAHCKTALTPYKVPHQVVFRSELPHSNVGKVLRRELKEEAPKG